VGWGSGGVGAAGFGVGSPEGGRDSAARMLGAPYSIRGTVEHGRKLAHQLGYPTANLDPGIALTPPDGVWVVRATCGDSRPLGGVANLGLRPTVDGTTRTLEVHLFDFSGDLYGQELEVEFIRHLRPEIRFASLDLLQQQIAADAEEARQWLLEREAQAAR